MHNFLNRLAWFASFSFAFVLIILFGIIFDLFPHGFEPRTIFLWVIGVGIVGTVCKSVFLSYEEIEKFAQNYNSEQIPQEKKTKVPKPIPTENVFTTLTNEEKNTQPPTENTKKKEEEKQEMKKQEILSVSEQKTSTITKKVGQVFQEMEKQKTSQPSFIQKFFTENIIAKMGGILLFLGVVFLLQLVYTNLTASGKLFIGFTIGMTLYCIGVFLDVKQYKKEARVLLGIGILINYLIILSGRYIIGYEDGSFIFNETLTFILLILNTIFAIVTSLYYKSDTLLILSFLFAYINPFLIGAPPQETPYTLLGYGLTVSFGALYLSHKFLSQEKQSSLILQHTGFWGGNVLFFVAPYTLLIHWIIKLFALALVSGVSIFSAFKNKRKQNVESFFIGAYAFFFMLVFIPQSSINLIENSILGFGSYTLFLLLAITFTIYLFLKNNNQNLLPILCIPLFILPLLTSTEIVPLDFISPSIAGTIITFIGIIILCEKKLSNTNYNFLFGALGIFLLLSSYFLPTEISGTNISIIQKLFIILSTFILLFSTYYYSCNKNLQTLYPCGTIFSILILLPILNNSTSEIVLSTITVLTLFIANISLPFLYKKYNIHQTQPTVIALIAGGMFGMLEIYFLTQNYITFNSIGFFFLFFALVYAFLGSLYSENLYRLITNKTTKINHDIKNTVYTYLGISISLFSIAIAFLFSQNPEVISLVWLFEATLIFFFFSKIPERKIYVSGLVLFLIGTFRLIELTDIFQEKYYYGFIPLILVAISLIGNMYFLRNLKGASRNFHDIIHGVCILVLYSITFTILPNIQFGNGVFIFALFSAVLSWLYFSMHSGYLRNILRYIILFGFFIHLTNLEFFFERINTHNILFYHFVQYATTALFVGSSFVIKKYTKHAMPFSQKITTIVYFFIATTYFVFELFEFNTFSITIYWSILAFTLLSYGIQKNILQYRTYGLYVLCFVVAKILFYDIWIGLEDALLRVIALMVTGALMIAISLLYSKKFGGDLKEELQLKNLI